MKILITGGTGLIGQALIPALIKSGNEIVLLTRDKKNVAHCFEKPLPALSAVVESLDSVEFNEIDAVINLAGEPIVNKRWSVNQKKQLCDSRWQLTRQLVEKIKQANVPPKVFISGSAIGIYGRQSQQSIDESFVEFAPEFTHTLCAEWENIAQDAATEYTRVALLRTGIVLTPKGGALAKMLPAFRMGAGGPIGSGQQVMSWIHIEDMIRAILFVLDHEAISGPVNMTAPGAVPNEVFSHTLASTLHRPCLFRVPAVVLKLAMGEMADLLIHGQSVFPGKLKEAGFNFHFPLLPEALADLLK